MTIIMKRRNFIQALAALPLAAKALILSEVEPQEPSIEHKEYGLGFRDMGEYIDTTMIADRDYHAGDITKRGNTIAGIALERIPKGHAGKVLMYGPGCVRR